jgi:DNA ligase-1
MKRFAALYRKLDGAAGNLDRLDALVDYFRGAPPEDAAWAVYFLAGGKPSQLVPTRVIVAAALTATALPDWLFSESYDAVGDLAETITLLLPEGQDDDDAGLAHWLDERLLPLRGQSPENQQAALLRMWATLGTWERFTCIKLMTGGLRVGVSRPIVTRALAAVAGLDPRVIAQRLVGYTDRRRTPSAAAYRALLAPVDAADTQADAGTPYPFFLAHPLQAVVDDFPALLGPPSQWLIEWKWDGIRAQLVRRSGDAWLWSRGEDLVTERFPEIVACARALPEGTVIDGEILAWLDDRVAPFALLQKRIGRKTLGAKVLAEAPVILMAYDLLELEGVDLRERPLQQRRLQLEALLGAHALPAIRLSPLLHEADWPALARQRDRSRALGVEGMLLKAADSRYGIGRTKASGVWWKWKIDPHTIDAVLLYAQPGHGKRASLYTDYTFAVWDEGATPRALVPFAKAYSGLTDAEIREVDAFVRRHTLEKFGPVRSVEPTLVFELGFEGIAASPRHRSGVAVRFPRILRWRQDKPAEQADTLATLRSLLSEGHAEAGLVPAAGDRSCALDRS